MKTRVHVNTHAIRRNKRSGTNEPVIAARTYRGVTYGHEVTIHGPSSIVYRPDRPLSCGARVWIETDSEFLGGPP